MSHGLQQLYAGLGLSPRCDGAELEDRAPLIPGASKKRKKAKKAKREPADEADGVTGQTASRIVRTETYRLVGRKTWADQRAHIVDSAVSAKEKRKILQRALVFKDFQLHKPPNLFQLPRDLHFSFDVLHSFGIAPDLRTLFLMLKSQDKVLSKDKKRRRPSSLIHFLDDALDEEVKCGRAETSDIHYQLYPLRPQLVSDGPDERYITLMSPPNKNGERAPQQYYAQPTGEIIDSSGNRYPSFIHDSDRLGTDLLNPAAFVLNFGNKLLWARENERYYAQKSPDEEYDPFAHLAPEIQLAYRAIDLLVYRFFSEPEEQAGTSRGNGPSPAPPLYAEIEAYLADQQAAPDRTLPTPPPTTPSHPRRRPPSPRPPSPDDGPTPRAARRSSAPSAGPLPPQPNFSGPMTRSRSDQGRDEVWIESGLSALRVTKVSIISQNLADHFTVRDCPSSALVSVVDASGKPFEAFSRADHALVGIASALLQSDQIWPKGSLSENLMELIDEALRILAQSVLIDISPDSPSSASPRLKPLSLESSAVFNHNMSEDDGVSISPLTNPDQAVRAYRSEGLRVFAFSVEDIPSDADDKAPIISNSRSCVVVGLEDPTLSSVPSLRDIAASLCLHPVSPVKLTKSGIRAGFSWRHHQRLDAEKALRDEDVDTNLRIELLFSSNISWEYRQKLMRALLFTGDQASFYGPIPPVLPPSLPLAPPSSSTRADKLPPSAAARQPLATRNTGPVTATTLQHISALKENEPTPPSRQTRRAARDRPSPTISALRTLR